MTEQEYVLVTNKTRLMEILDALKHVAPVEGALSREELAELVPKVNLWLHKHFNLIDKAQNQG